MYLRATIDKHYVYEGEVLETELEAALAMFKELQEKERTEGRDALTYHERSWLTEYEIAAEDSDEDGKKAIAMRWISLNCHKFKSDIEECENHVECIVEEAEPEE